MPSWSDDVTYLSVYETHAPCRSGAMDVDLGLGLQKVGLPKACEVEVQSDR